MHILGIGIDVVKVTRIKNLLDKKKTHLAHRILSTKEMENYRLSKNNSLFLSKHFAVKEAVAKALGTGFRNGIFFNNFELYSEKTGKPKIQFLKKAKYLKKNLKIKNVHVSISKEKEYVWAIVILES